MDGWMDGWMDVEASALWAKANSQPEPAVSAPSTVCTIHAVASQHMRAKKRC